MINQIREINFGPGTAADYATLHQATVTLVEMGDRTISTQVRIDGDIVPDFAGWELEFKGERFILPIREPQAAKDNASRNSLIDLTFHSWATYQLQRYFFMTTAQIGAGTAVADQYIAPVVLPLHSFVDLFNSVLNYYFNGKIVMSLNPNGDFSSEPIAFEINYTYIYDVLTKFYEIFGVRWRMEHNSDTDVYTIMVGYDAPEITSEDHIFQYGYEGGLLKFERQVQDYDIKNILLGRGGEKNLPYRYFKRIDEHNPNWSADPDAIPELANIYFDRLRDKNFRNYIQGWRTNPNRDTSWEAVQTYDSIRAQKDWAYKKGHEDKKFNPVEYVKDDDSIAKYGERWGNLDDNNDIFPTIQGITRPGLGRVDEVVDISEILSDNIDKAAESAATYDNIDGIKRKTVGLAKYSDITDSFVGGTFSVPSGTTGYLTWLIDRVAKPRLWHEKKDPPISSYTELVEIAESSVRVFDAETDEEVSSAAIPAGDYYYKVQVTLRNGNSVYVDVTYSINSLTLYTSKTDSESWKPTFDIWVKNIWETTQDRGENETEYAARVWEPILGDRVGNEAKIVFSTGFMSLSEDYEFTIASYPVVDRTKSINGVPSEWRITVYKSDAEYESTGLFVPSAEGGKPTAGDKFYFIGIDMPHQYIIWGEELLTASKEEELQKVSSINPQWVISLDKVRVHTIEQGDYNMMLADRLESGVKLRIKDKRFTGNDALVLYVQTITYTWNEPSNGAPYLVPDIEVILSDKIVATEGSISKMQSDIGAIKASYVRAYEVEEMVRRTGSAMFLSKTGESQKSYSPTEFASILFGQGFRQGAVGGAGWGFYQNGNGQSVLEVDKIVARQELNVNSLVANQIAYIGGKQIISAASLECIQVMETDNEYICYFDQKQGTVANLFAVGDIAMGQIFSPNNRETRFYKFEVSEVGENYISLDKSISNGGGTPEVGDIIVQFGNTTNVDRQFVIIRDVIGGGYERMLSGLNSVNAAGDEYYFAGYDKQPIGSFIPLQDSNGADLYDSQGRQLGYFTPKQRWFVGDKTQEYAEWVDGALTIKGRIYVRNTAGNYADMSTYLSTVDYLQAALPKDLESITTITGGVVLSTIIGVQSSGNLVAGINASSLGEHTTHGKLMIFAGAENAQSVNSASFRVYADGTIYTNRLAAEAGCYIGGFYVQSNAILGMTVLASHYTSGSYPYRDDINIWPTQIGIRSRNTTSNNEMGSILVGWGLNAPYMGDWQLLTITNARNASDSFSTARNKGIKVSVSGTGMEHRGIEITASGDSTDNYGIYVSASGTNSNNYAIYAASGMFAGLRPYVRTLSSNTTLTSIDFSIVVAGDTIIRMPSSPQIGQTYFVVIPRKSSSSHYRVEFNGNGKTIKRLGYSADTTQVHTSFVGIDILVYDGTSWQMSSCATT